MQIQIKGWDRRNPAKVRNGLANGNPINNPILGLLMVERRRSCPVVDRLSVGAKLMRGAEILRNVISGPGNRIARSHRESGLRRVDRERQ